MVKDASSSRGIKGQKGKRPVKGYEVKSEEVSTTDDIQGEEVTFTFKSKYRDDMISLIKPLVETLADGSKRVRGATWAEFGHNTFSTRDGKIATLLRGKIKERLKGSDPLNVVETTSI